MERTWLRPTCWKEVLKKMPIPCVDVVIHSKGRVLMGWRSIPPYRNVWALLGGRMHYGETFEETALRNCLKSGLHVSDLSSLGVFPVRFRTRHDITMCIAAELLSGIPKPTPEMRRYRWYRMNEIERIDPIGGNYRRMLQHWLSYQPGSDPPQYSAQTISM
jgi:ADP-ribose pyrophosphatase YjhB (NUDIX family)